ncbi:hypothetical protein [Labrys neptuniae]
MKFSAAMTVTLALTSSVHAEPFRDATTGFGIGPLPTGFEVRPYPQPDGAAFEISSPAGRTGHCMATFVTRPAVARPPSGDHAVRAALVAAARLSLRGDSFSKVRGIRQLGAPGITFTFDMGKHTLSHLRFLWAAFESAKGRTTVSCFTFVERFKQQRPDFETIVRAVMIPR